MYGIDITNIKQYFNLPRKQSIKSLNFRVVLKKFKEKASFNIVFKKKDQYENGLIT